MEKQLQTLRYVSKGFGEMIAIGFVAIHITVAATNLIFHLTDQYNTVHLVVPLTVPFELSCGIFSLLIGLILFNDHFKVALANGVSRKSFLLANLPAIGLTAAVFSIFNFLVVLVHGLFWPIIMIGDLLYPGIDWVGLLIGQFALYFLLIMAGWLISLAYYRSSGWAQVAISLSPFALFGLLKVANASTGGAIFEAIGQYMTTSLGLVAGQQDPYTAAVSMLIWSAVLCGLVYLLLRRAPAKA